MASRPRRNREKNQGVARRMRNSKHITPGFEPHPVGKILVLLRAMPGPLEPGRRNVPSKLRHRAQLLMLCATACWAADIRWNFEGGNLQRVEKVAADHFR